MRYSCRGLAAFAHKLLSAHLARFMPGPRKSTGATPPGRACLTYLGSPRVIVFSELIPSAVSQAPPVLRWRPTRRRGHRPGALRREA